MRRITLGIAAAALLTLTACGADPAEPQETPPVSVPSVDVPTVDPDVTPDETATPNGTASPTGTATPNGTATPTGTATPNGTATPAGTASPTQVARELPARVESFNRVEQRTENDVRIGSYYSDSLKAVIEVRLAQGGSVNQLITSLGGANPTTVGDAQCSTQGDTICGQERDGVTVVASTKQLPASLVANFTSQVLGAS